MPIYEYLCERCGPFENERPMRESALPRACPDCGADAPRALLTAPRMSGLSTELRLAHATNERSAHEPQAGAGHRHGPGCGCSGGRQKKESGSAAKGFPGRRPWMISH